MADFLKNAVYLGFGVISITREKVEEMVKEWVDEGKIQPSQTNEFINRLLERGEKERAELQWFIQDIRKLEERLERLEKGQPVSGGEQ